jgi:glycosyltransferase involved in cell wall biosynthesis
MRVALVTSFPRDPDSPRGGVESVSVNLAGALSRFEDLDVHVVTTDAGRDSVARHAWTSVTVHRLPWRGRTRLGGALGKSRAALRRYLVDLAPHVVHAHDTYGLMVRGLPLPRVFTVHGFIHADTRVSGTRFARLRSLLWRLAEEAAWADQPHIISISPYVRERLAGVARGLIHDIDNPIAESFFTLARREEPGSLFSAAAISPRKNTLRLVEALARLRADGVDARLRLAGPLVDPDYAARVRRRVQALGLSERVELLGPVSRSSVQAELCRASVFVLVSLEENAPLGIEEAMAVGVPVVTSNRCGMPHMVRHGESGFLVEPDDPGEIAARLRQLLVDVQVRDAMSRSCRAAALERFHPARVAARTREVYLQAAARA